MSFPIVSRQSADSQPTVIRILPGTLPYDSAKNGTMKLFLEKFAYLPFFLYLCSEYGEIKRKYQ